MKKIAFVILMGGVALGSCKKLVEKDDLDKQVNIYFVGDLINSHSTTIFDPTWNQSILKDFDKRDYKYIDSITFNLGIVTENSSDTAYVRLYNLTDNVEIANSLIKGATNGFAVPYLEINTNNIIKNLPEKRIDLAVQIRSSISPRSAIGNTPYLKLRRN
jgi:hypothetical protein